MAAGDFTASAMPDILIKINEIFAGTRHNPELNKDIDTIQALATRQTANLEKAGVMLDALNCVGAKVVFLKKCTNSAVDIIETPIDDCDLAGAEMESVALSLANNLGYRDSFKVLGSDCKDLFTMQEKVAKGMAIAMVNVEEKINLAAIAFLAANTQAVDDPGEYSETGDIVNVPSDSWKPELLADMAIMAKQSRLYNPFIVTGSNLYVANFLADYRTPSSPSVDPVLKSGPFDIVFDVQNMDTTIGAKATFLIDPSSYVFWPTNQYENMAPEPLTQGGTVYKWRMRAPRLQYNDNGTLKPVYFDVESQEVCEVVGGVKYVNRIFNVIFRGGLQLGPQVCDANDTGIVQFNKLEE